MIGAFHVPIQRKMFLDHSCPKRHGSDGNDVIIELPVGSIISNLTGDGDEKKNTETNPFNKKIALTKEGEKVLLLTGGRGGLGNEHFKASTNTTPYESTPGKEGEEASHSALSLSTGSPAAIIERCRVAICDVPSQRERFARNTQKKCRDDSRHTRQDCPRHVGVRRAWRDAPSAAKPERRRRPR